MEVITYGNVGTLAGILQAIAYMTGQQDYLTTLTIVVMLGFMAALVAYAFAPQKLVGWYWLASVLAVSSLTIIPKVQVQVIDRLQTAAPKVVNNVPYGLALVAHLTSRVGDSLTDMFETTFRDPAFNSDMPGGLGFFDQLTYRQSGMMFGNKILRESARVTFPDADFRFDMQQYLQNCVVPDISDGTLDANTVRSSTNLWETLTAYGANPARFSPVAAGTVRSCLGLQTDLMGERMEEQTAKAKSMLGRRLNADASSTSGGNPLTTTQSNAAVDAQVEQAYLRTQLGGASTDAAALIRQNAMINAMSDANSMLSQRTNDPTAAMLGLAEAQAKVSQNSSWITSAKIAEEAMPLIRNGIEAILYAAFPIVILVLFLTTGMTTMKLAKSYVGALMWIQLWPPLYAVLNYMATAASARHLNTAGALPDGGTGLALLTSASIYENSISDLAVVGYLVISIPVIAWSLIKGMDSIGSGALAGAAAFSGGSAAGASAAASGNISLGNATMDQVNLAPSYRAANFSTYEDAAGTFTRDGSGRGLNSGVLKQSNVGVDASHVHREAERVGQAAQQQVEAGNRDSVQLNSSLSSTFSDTLALTGSRGSSSTNTTTSAHGNSGSSGLSGRERLSSIESGDSSQSTTTSDRSAAGRVDANMRSEATSAEASAGLGIGGFGAKVGQSIGRGTSATGTETQEHSAMDALIASKADGWRKSKDSDQVVSEMETFTQSAEFRQALESKNEAAMRLQAGYEEARSLQTSREDHFSEARSLQNRAESMRENSANIAVNLNNYAYSQMEASGQVEQHAIDMHTNPAAAGQRVYDAVQPAVHGLHNTSYGHGGPPGYGQQSAPVEDRLQPIEDERVDRVRGQFESNRSNADDVWEHQSEKRDAVGDAATRRGVGMDGGGGGGGGGRGAALQQEVQAGLAANSLNAQQRQFDNETHVMNDQAAIAGQQREGTHQADNPQVLPDGRGDADPVTAVANEFKAPRSFTGYK